MWKRARMKNKRGKRLKGLGEEKRSKERWREMDNRWAASEPAKSWRRDVRKDEQGRFNYICLKLLLFFLSSSSSFPNSKKSPIHLHAPVSDRPMYRHLHRGRATLLSSSSLSLLSFFLSLYLSFLECSRKRLMMSIYYNRGWCLPSHEETR